MSLKKGIYIIADPAMGEKRLMKKIRSIGNSHVAALQIWDNFQPGPDARRLIDSVCDVAHQYDIPVFVNNRADLLKDTAADGLHFDIPPEDFEAICLQVGRSIRAGITCNNDLAAVRWAIDHRLDYISFCSVFHSTTANSCDLVTMETVKAAREMTSIPIFLAGGITPERIGLLSEWPYDGVAIAGSIMRAPDARDLLNRLNNAMKP